MVVRALDHVAQCYSADDGSIIARVLREQIGRDSRVTLSFDGVSDVPSSFVNTAIVSFLEDHSLDWLKRHISIVNVSQQTADMIRRCMANSQRPSQAA